jgi:hypothetical protein
VFFDKTHYRTLNIENDEITPMNACFEKNVFSIVAVSRYEKLSSVLTRFSRAVLKKKPHLLNKTEWQQF